MGGVLQCKLEVYCRVFLSSRLRSQQGTALEMGGVRRYELEVCCQYSSDKLYGLGAPTQCPNTFVAKCRIIFVGVLQRVMSDRQSGKTRILTPYCSRKQSLGDEKPIAIGMFKYCEEPIACITVILETHCANFGFRVATELPSPTRHS